MLPDLLSSRSGRLAAFAALYVCEGLPHGFATVAVTLELKRMGLDAAALGAFAAAILGPWAWKWAAGPFVDNLRLPGVGRRKGWILLSQAGLLGGLVLALLAFPRLEGGEIVGLPLFTTLLVLANVCSATQDVAIDALAVETLRPDEKGLANGLMFAGAQVGAAVGGSGVLLLKSQTSFGVASLLVPIALGALVAANVVLLREPSAPAAAARGVGAALGEVRAYVEAVLRVFLLSRNGLLGLVLALLPMGGMALSLVVSTVITPTLGMTDDEIASLNLVASGVFVVCCVVGGFVSDRFGRRRTVALFSLLTLLPTLWMAWQLEAAGLRHPTDPGPDGSWPRHEALIRAWWAAQLAYTVFQGLMYGVRTALFMDLTEPRVAATQFTAFMALLNVVTMYSNGWEGLALTSVAEGGWGLTYAQVLGVDCALGATFVLVLPWVKLRDSRTQATGHTT